MKDLARLFLLTLVLFPWFNSAAAQKISPQLAVGSEAGLEAVTTIILVNVSSSSRTISFELFSPDGSEQTVDVQLLDNPPSPASSGEITLEGDGATLITLSSDGPLSAGWILFTGDVEEVEIQVSFVNLNMAGQVVAAVGVPVQEPEDDFFLAGQFTPGTVNVGLAAANPNQQELSLQFRLLDLNGQEVATEQVSVDPMAQQAQFLDQLFPGVQAMTVLVLEVSGDADFALLGLRTDTSGEFLLSGIQVFR